MVDLPTFLHYSKLDYSQASGAVIVGEERGKGVGGVLVNGMQKGVEERVDQAVVLPSQLCGDGRCSTVTMRPLCGWRRHAAMGIYLLR